MYLSKSGKLQNNEGNSFLKPVTKKLKYVARVLVYNNDGETKNIYVLQTIIPFTDNGSFIKWKIVYDFLDL